MATHQVTNPDYLLRTTWMLKVTRSPLPRQSPRRPRASVSVLSVLIRKLGGARAESRPPWALERTEPRALRCWGHLMGGGVQPQGHPQLRRALPSGRSAPCGPPSPERPCAARLPGHSRPGASPWSAPRDLAVARSGQTTPTPSLLVCCAASSSENKRFGAAQIRGTGSPRQSGRSLPSFGSPAQFPDWARPRERA